MLLTGACGAPGGPEWAQQTTPSLPGMNQGQHAAILGLRSILGPSMVVYTYNLNTLEAKAAYTHVA